MLPDNNRWAVRLWIAAIGVWLVIDSGRQWHASSSATNFFAPPTATTAAMTDRYATWFRKFSEARKRPDGLPATDLPDIFQKPQEPLVREPASRRARGNRLELYRQKDGPIVFYDVAGDKGLIIIETNQPVVKFTAGDQKIQQPLLSVPGGVAIEVAHLPLSFFQGNFRDRRTVLQLYDAGGTRLHFLQLSLEDSAEISVFKGQRPQSPLGPELAQQLLLSSDERIAKMRKDHFQHLGEITDINNISHGYTPSPTPRSCVQISPIVIITDKPIGGTSNTPGWVGFDGTTRSVAIRGLPVAAGAYTLEITEPLKANDPQAVRRQVTTASDTLRFAFADIPPARLAPPALIELRLRSPANSGPQPDVSIHITSRQMHDIKLCNDDPARKLPDTVGKD